MNFQRDRVLLDVAHSWRVSRHGQVFVVALHLLGEAGMRGGAKSDLSSARIAPNAVVGFSFGRWLETSSPFCLSLSAWSQS